MKILTFNNKFVILHNELVQKYSVVYICKQLNISRTLYYKYLNKGHTANYDKANEIFLIMTNMLSKIYKESVNS